MNRIFDIDNGFFRFMGMIFDFIVLDLLTLICCIPLVTIGPAITSLYYVGMKRVRNEEGYIIKDFFKSFKRNFKQGFIIELIIAVCAAFLIVDINVTYTWMNSDEESILVRLLFYALIGLAFIAVITAIYVFPVLAKFENTTKQLIINSAMMAVKHLSFSILMVVIYAAMAVAIYIYPIVLFFIIGFAAAINSVILRKIFDNYIRVDSQGKVISEQVTGSAEDVENDLTKAQDSTEDVGNASQDNE